MINNTKVTVKQMAYDIIKSKILSCEYEPGRVINEAMLCDEIGVSRTPIREALSDLEHEMLVTVYPKKGTMVSKIDFSVVNDVFQVRRLIEPFIIRNYGVLINKDTILQARDVQETICLDKTTSNYHYKSDEDLHQAIVAANPNQYLTESLLKVYNQNQRIRILTGNTSEERLVISSKEHIRIIDFILCDEFQAAADEMLKHLMSSWQSTIDMLVVHK